MKWKSTSVFGLTNVNFLRTSVVVAHETKGIVKVGEPVPLTHSDSPVVHEQVDVWNKVLCEVCIFRLPQRQGTCLTK